MFSGSHKNHVRMQLCYVCAWVGLISFVFINLMVHNYL